MLEQVSCHTSEIHLQSLECVCQILMIYSKKSPFIERANAFIRLTHMFQILCMHVQTQSFSQVNRFLWRIQKPLSWPRFWALKTIFSTCKFLPLFFLVVLSVIIQQKSPLISIQHQGCNITSNRKFHAPGTLETPVQKMVSTLRKVHVVYGSGNFPEQFYP